MPSLSINSKDLDSLGINLKDLLRAIAQTKSSGDDVIKIKKRKKKVKKVKTKVKGATRSPMTPDPTASGIAGLSKNASMNPFPPAQKISNLPVQVSGGGASFQPPPFQTKIEVKNEPQRQTDNINQQQLVTFQNETKQQLKDIQDAQAYNTYGLHATGLALTKMLKSNNRQGFYNQSLPPPTNLGNLYSGTYHREYEVDTSDREGVVATNDPMENIRVQEITFEENPLNQQVELAPVQAQFRLGSEERVEDQQQTDYATDIQDTVGFQDVQSELEPSEIVPQIEATPEVKFDEVYPEEIPRQRKQYYKKVPQEQQKKRGRKPKNQEERTEEEPAIFEDLMNLVDEKKLTPKKQPLTDASVRMTRKNSDHSKLVNTDTGISPFGEAKKKSKQQTLNEFYGRPNDDETD